jgi:hypothetical protein
MGASDPRFRRAKRSTTWRGIGALATVFGLVLVAPATTALTYRAPYAHVEQVKLDWLRSATGCASRSGSMPTFNGATGNFSWRGKTSVGYCTSHLHRALTDNVAESEGASELSVPVRAPSRGVSPVTIDVTWNLTAAGSISIHPTGPCIDPLAANTSGSYFCYAIAQASLMGGAWLVDLTNGSVTTASNQPIVSGVGYEYLNYTSCSPNCTSFAFGFKSGAPFSGLQSDTFVINATMNSAHKYALVTYVGGFAGVELDGYAGHARASVNIGTAGNGAQLVSIVET